MNIIWQLTKYSSWVLVVIVESEVAEQSVGVSSCCPRVVTTAVKRREENTVNVDAVFISTIRENN